MDLTEEKTNVVVKFFETFFDKIKFCILQEELIYLLVTPEILIGAAAEKNILQKY